MDARTESYIALAGPVVGSLGALACLFAAQAFESRLLLALAYSGFMINLWNLIPINPLDGGRIVGILSPRIWLLGGPLLIGLFLLQPSPMILLILLFAAPSMLAVWRVTWREQMPERYYEQPLAVKLKYGAIYLGLAAFLAAMTYDVHETLRGTVPQP